MSQKRGPWTFGASASIAGISQRGEMLGMGQQRRSVIGNQHRPQFDQPVQLGVNQRVPCANCAGICATFRETLVSPMTFGRVRVQYRPIRFFVPLGKSM